MCCALHSSCVCLCVLCMYDASSVTRGIVLVLEQSGVCNARTRSTLQVACGVWLPAGASTPLSSSRLGLHDKRPKDERDERNEKSDSVMRWRGSPQFGSMGGLRGNCSALQRSFDLVRARRLFRHVLSLCVVRSFRLFQVSSVLLLRFPLPNNNGGFASSDIAFPRPSSISDFCSLTNPSLN